MIKDDEPCVAFMNAKTRQELKELPDEVVVISELCDDDEIIVVPAKEFVTWLYGHYYEVCNGQTPTLSM